MIYFKERDRVKLKNLPSYRPATIIRVYVTYRGVRYDLLFDDSSLEHVGKFWQQHELILLSPLQELL